MRKKTASWHGYHDVLCDWDIPSRKVRIASIKANKPAHEQPLRLRLYKPMSAEACGLLAAHHELVGPTWAATYSHGAGHARAADNEAVGSAWAALEAIHKIECPNCPWNGMSIFPEAKEPTP